MAITQRKYPMYYPGMLKDEYFNDITRYEFNYTYYNFSISNVMNFNTITLPKLIKEYNPDKDILLPKDPKEEDLTSQKTKYYYNINKNRNKNSFLKYK